MIFARGLHGKSHRQQRNYYGDASNDDPFQKPLAQLPNLHDAFMHGHLTLTALGQP